MQKRLREERERLGYTQGELAKLAGIKVLSQGNYERGVTEPKGSYFMLLHSLGADIFYILTGDRTSGELISTEEKLLLEKYREADTSTQKNILTLLLFGSTNSLDNKNQLIGNYIKQNQGDVANTMHKIIKGDKHD